MDVASGAIWIGCAMRVTMGETVAVGERTFRRGAKFNLQKFSFPHFFIQE
jgi:hypothetical protein